MAHIFPITSAAARAILKERRVTMAQFNRTGQLDLDINTRLTKVGRCRWQIVDLYDQDGKNLAPYLPAEQQRALPAFQKTAEAPTFAENDDDREKAAALHCDRELFLRG